MPKYIISTKNKNKLLDDFNYIYNKHKENCDGSKQYWNCENRTCKARVHSQEDGDTIIITKTVGEHNHASTSADATARAVQSSLKRKALETQYSSRTILSTETATLDECELAKLPKMTSMSRNIRRWRLTEDNAPAIPQLRDGYVIPVQYTVLDCGDKFLQYDSGEGDPQRMLIFATDAGLRDLKETRNWAGDGTFKCCPSIYYQLYTLHIQRNNVSAARMFALLPDKSGSTYSRLFTKLKELLDDGTEPETMITDFEKAAINSFSEVFPNTNMSGCLFHLSQNIYKHVVSLGYKQRYHHDNEFSVKVRCFAALAFLPLQDVVDGFEQLSDDEDLPQELVTYFENYYIGAQRGRGQRRRRVEPTYPIALWNVHDRVMNNMPRTNNNLEGFHNALRSSVTNTHPNIWHLVKALKKEETISRNKIAELSRGNIVIQNRIYRAMNHCIRALTDAYNPANKLHFLRGISHNLKTF